MFTQLSLFDSVGSVDSLSSGGGFVHVSPAKRSSAKDAKVAGIAATSATCREAGSDVAVRREPARRESLERPSLGRGVAYERRADALQPMGELAQLVLARYDLLASRRRERERLRREQPRKSIRVLSPPATVS